jgi:hypothetical protein
MMALVLIMLMGFRTMKYLWDNHIETKYHLQGEVPEGWEAPEDVQEK